MNTMKSKLTTLTCLTLVACCHLKAELIFSNMGPNNDNYSSGVGHTIQVTASSYQAYAMGFRTGATPYVFTELQLPLLNLSGIDNLTISLHGDAGVGPGSVVETLSIDSSVFPDYPQPFSITSLESTALPTLAANSVYWITLEPTEIRSCWYSWSELLTIPQRQILASSYNPSANTPLPWSYSYAFQNGSAFAVYGNPVPEPSTLTILAVGGVLVLRCRRLRRLYR
jgi:hypothetical protein